MVVEENPFIMYWMYGATALIVVFWSIVLDEGEVFGLFGELVHRTHHRIKELLRY